MVSLHYYAVVHVVVLVTIVVVNFVLVVVLMKMVNVVIATIVVAVVIVIYVIVLTIVYMNACLNIAGDVVLFSGNYYSAIRNIDGSASFNASKWNQLSKKPVAGLLPNFDYKISQFNDFYNLNIDNFDAGQQKLAQHLTGYTPRPYLTDIITDPIAQYKFYQGFIREKGTQNAIDKLAKATIHNHQGNIIYNEEWAFRVGEYGSYTNFQELEIVLPEGTFVDNPQAIVFADSIPTQTPNDLKYYSTASDWMITPSNYVSSSTFMTNSGTYLVNDLVLSTAGYPRIDDVTYTVFSKNDLINFASDNQINEGDVFWVGFTDNSDWDVLRYTRSTVQVISEYVNYPGISINFVTNNNHGLSIGEIVSVNNFDANLDGIYVVTDVPDAITFTVDSSSTYVIGSTTSTGVLFEFQSARYSTFDDLPDNNILLGLPENSNVWIDNNGNDEWAVYSKINNYSVFTVTNITNQVNQQFGWSISKRPGSNIVVVGSPGYSTGDTYGRVSLYVNNNGNLSRKLFYSLNESNATHATNATQFGYSVFYDDQNFNNTGGYGLIYAGAPFANDGAFVQSGLIKISSIDPVLVQEFENNIISNPNPGNYSLFGSSIYVQRTTSTNYKHAIITAPGTTTTGTGRVYIYEIDTVGIGLVATLIPPIGHTTIGIQWGYSISGSEDGTVVAISALGNSHQNGYIQIYTGTNVISSQNIPSPYDFNDLFGYKVLVSPDGSYLLISAPQHINNDGTRGIVQIWTSTNGTFVFNQSLTNPELIGGVMFGVDMDINTENTSLVISSLGSGIRVPTTFDITSTLSEQTTFDSKSTDFFGTIANSGKVYVYNRLASRFVIAQELDPVSTVDGTDYGFSVVIDSNVVLVGAPAYDNTAISSELYQFNKTNSSVNGWELLRFQEDLVDLTTVNRTVLIDTFNDEIVNYLDIIDPLKGKIAGLAEQELTYKMAIDPAIYSVGTSTTIINTSSNWLDSHIGELWWDLSTVKYQWYEQGENSFRKNQWGKLFPGASIDVYEWIGTNLLPSEWVVLADTALGLTTGISGRPKHPDDSVYSAKQIYDPVTNSFSNFYFYWVINKVTVPNVKNRRTSAYDVSSIILDPKSYGLQYVSVISKDAIAVANVGSQLIENRIDLNISMNLSNNIPKHTEWLLLQEGSENSIPNKLLDKKLFDSLLGRDSLGNTVPDPSLSSRQAYGIGIRPRQSIFVNRLDALRNLIDYANIIFSENLITGNYNFDNLNSQEQIPDISTNLYDQIVEDNDALSIINTNFLKTAQLTCTVSNGQIRSVIINDPGYGYVVPPTVTITGVGTGGIINTSIDIHGRVISTDIISGSGYVDAPILIVRPYTVIVLSDNTAHGKWAQFVFDNSISKWIRYHTQSYNTSLYWNYVDWASTDFNTHLDYTITVENVYQTDNLSLESGQYVKVKNNGIGNYIILEAVASGGNYTDRYNIVYAQNGTIRLLDDIWNLPNSNFGYDEIRTYDQTLYDQSADLELFYILTALKENIFINKLKVYWNLFFFKAVKYALSEQKLLDWAFKTSFIDVSNQAGQLSQPPVYKLIGSTVFEKYIEEVKPYHTQIRNFTENYTITEPTHTVTSDFEVTSNPIVDPIRHMDITIKFDRISTGNQIGANTYYDSFLCDGSANAYTLTWLAQPDKALITMTVNKRRVLWSDYTLEYYTKEYNGYNKEFCNIVFVNNVPTKGQLLEVAYTKNVSALSAVDRIQYYYTATSGMPGLDLGQLMYGIQYPETQLQTIAFDYSTAWDSTTYDQNTWGDSIVSYELTTSTRTASIGTNTIYINTLTGITTGTLVNVTSTLTNVFVTSTVYVTAMSTAVIPEAGPITVNVDGGGGSGGSITTSFTIASNIATNQIQNGWLCSVAGYTQTFNVTSIISGGGVLTIELNDGEAITLAFPVVFYLPSYTAYSVITNSTLSSSVIAGSTIEFWTLDSNATILDTTIDGGTWTGTNITGALLTGALGINPDDVTLDGDGFFTPNTSYAPEELVPGQTLDSLGIDVYTKSNQGAPLIFTGIFHALANTISSVVLPILPSTGAAITVTSGSQEFTYTTGTIAFNQFTIDWETRTLSVLSTVETSMGYYIIDVGGGSGATAGVVDYKSLTVIDQSSAELTSFNSYGTILSAYVTVNGISIPLQTTSTQYGYVLSQLSSINNRASVKIQNLPAGTNTIQAWFFTDAYDYFNEVTDQIFNIDVLGESLTWTLTRPPGTIGPSVANASVEYINDYGNIIQLLPPYISYYNITDVQASFLINNAQFRPSPFYSVDTNYAEVYLNGIKLRPGFDFTINSVNNTIMLNPGIGAIGDALAIVDLYPSSYQFNIEGSTLILFNSFPNGKIRVTTYTDHDGMLMRTQYFAGNPSNRFKLSAPVYNTNYIWINMFNRNGTSPLIANQDYQILSDGVTIQISDSYYIPVGDTLIIRYITNQVLSNTIIGYRIFNDIFNRTSFKRISSNNTTYLTQPLSFTDTKITVNDASLLTPPIPSRKSPGVILIAGERIEFYKVNGNTLSQLRRSTLGTSPKFYSDIYTEVIDHGIYQTIPFSEQIYTQIHYTTSTTTTYTISTVTTTATGYGITLSTSTVDIPAVDQVQVYYGGRLLNKSGIYYQDVTVAYDNPLYTISGTTSTSLSFPTTTILGTAYLVTSTNQVWVYQESLSADAVNGYVYSGLKYLPPEFSINTSTQQITLNIQEGIGDNIKLVVVKKQFADSTLWNNGISILDSDTVQAKFLQQGPAKLPTSYYIQDPNLTNEAGSVLTDQNNNPIEGL